MGLMMNVKIEELAIRSGGRTIDVCHGHGEYHDEFQLKNNDIQKFAELLIQEAMDIVRDEVSFHSDWACADATIQKVKDHFGGE